MLPTWPEDGPRLVWKIGNLGHGWSSPIIVGDRLYITGDVDDDLVIFAFDLDGKPLWQAKNGAAWTGPHPGARACCAYSEGKLYHMNAHGRVACLDAATGKELWAVNMLERFQGQNITWAMSECLLVDGPRLIVTPGGQKALMAALDKQSGQTVWTTEPLAGDRAGVRLADAVSLCRPPHRGQLLVGPRFRRRCRHGQAALDRAAAEPLRHEHHHAGLRRRQHFLRDGLRFRRRATDLLPATDGFRPEKAWTTTLDSCTGAVLLVDGLLLGSGYEKHKSWLCLDWQSGQVRYEFKGLTTSSAVYADGRLYCLAEDGRAALLKPTPERCEIVGQFRLVPEKTHDAWAYPVVLHGRLYLRYHDTLWCYDVAASDGRPGCRLGERAQAGEISKLALTDGAFPEYHAQPIFTGVTS